MRSPVFTALPLLLTGLALCLVSLSMLQANEVPSAPAVLILPESSFSSDPIIEDWMLQGWMPSPLSERTTEREPSNEPATEVTNGAPIVRIRIPRVGIDAPVDIRGVDSTGAMQDPEGPVAVAWYDFSARPGTVGNVVMAGHVDYHNYGPAVFWRLRDLKPGDRVEVSLADGETFVYEVATTDYYSAASAPVDEIVGSTPYEALTMITCGGSFNSSRLEYDQRLIVRAMRVANTAAAAIARDR